MIKALFKKQLLEISKGFLTDRKTGSIRTGSKLVGMLILYGFLLVSLSMFFFPLCFMLAEPLAADGMTWLYFAVTGLVSMVLGVFGSVFSTFSSLYQAKDNDLLLSMPIPPSSILLVRLLGVYAIGAVYCSIAMVPALIVHFIMAADGALSVILPILLWLLITVFVAALSCILGWVVAQIHARLRHKSIITVVMSLAFLAAYYYVYFRAQNMLQSLLENRSAVAEKVKGSLYPVYIMGRAGAGEPVPMIFFALAVLLLSAAVFAVLSSTFIKTATANRGAARIKYHEKTAKKRSAGTALFFRELGRFLSSPTYMLNCGLGMILLAAGGVLLLLKGSLVAEHAVPALAMFGRPLAALALVLICLISSMTNISAPSVSLEGKTLWIARSMPVKEWTVLRSKLLLHIVLSGVPTLFCCVCAAFGLGLTFAEALALTAAALAFVVLSAVSGLWLGLRSPNLNWTSEAVVVKQGMAVFISIFGSWGVVAVLIALYFLTARLLPSAAFLLICAALFAGLSALLTRWLKTKGCRIFSEL